jgi:hypothetical protein
MVPIAMPKAPLKVGKEFLPRLLGIFQRRLQCVMIGDVSVELGYSLQVCEWQFNELLERGAIRQLTPAERVQASIDDEVLAYFLLDATKFTLGE